MKTQSKNKSFVLYALLITVGVTALIWQSRSSANTPEGFASGNGRLEATEIDIATKIQGRVESVLVHEGDTVEEGQIIAHMDAAVLRAQLGEAEATQRRAEADRNVALAIVTQRENEYEYAAKVLKRSQQLFNQNVVEQNQLDHDQTAEKTAKAIWLAATAQASSADAAIEAAAATVVRIKADIDDTILKSPRLGRVQYRLAEPGEVLGAGGKVVTLIDITDVYLTFFLPTKEAGRVSIGGDARIMLDALPNRAIPAKVSFVSPIAQFTPKEVETQSEREKLMFRVKVKIQPELLLKYMDKVKTGLPGTGYVQLDSALSWPDYLNSDLTQSRTNTAK